MTLQSENILLVATGNRGKAREFQALLRPLLSEDLLVLTLADLDPRPPEVEEDAPTFAGNALKKARAAARATGLATLSDDSGLVVDALDGAPGVYSARFAGLGATDAENNALLLERLDALGAHSPEARAAHFACALCLVLTESPLSRILADKLQRREPDEDGAFLFQGTCPGFIAEEPRGENGFGYDPLFVEPRSGKTFAELSPAEKSATSHRARAVEALRRALEGP